MHTCKDLKILDHAIKKYYDQLATKYDDFRFNNSYGRFIHAQETKIIKKHLSQLDHDNNLDLACGTGRFLPFATHGVDLSQAMLQQAAVKFPNVSLHQADAQHLPFSDSHFDNVTCFHLMMHLDLDRVKKILTEIARVTKKGGCCIFDMPSKKRRNLTRHTQPSWHGGSMATVQEIKTYISTQWNLNEYHGVAFFPLHRIPKSLRKNFLRVDTFLCNSYWREYASHLVYVLEKK